MPSWFVANVELVEADILYAKDSWNQILLDSAPDFLSYRFIHRFETCLEWFLDGYDFNLLP